MKRLTPIKAIRAKCLDCCCQQPGDVRKCRIETCALWPYRMGRRPTAAPGPVSQKNRTLVVDFQQGGAS